VSDTTELSQQNSGIQLADAQLVIAREYGFTSWPKLVRYFGDVDRQGKRIEFGNRQTQTTAARVKWRERCC
jgi:hypothetical protein